MNLINAATLAAYVIVSVAGLAMIKSGRGISDLKTWLGAFCYGSGFIIWIVFLMRVPLSRAFPLAAGCLIVATQVAGWYFLKERMTPVHLLGIVVILAGVALIAKQG